MLIIPAIDIRSGKVVMLRGGRIEDEKIYSNDPVYIAKLWQAKGAKRLHIIDIDGALSGSPKNLEILKSIKAQTSVEIQLGGGLRNLEIISQVIELGIDKVILGTILSYNPGETKKIIDKYKDNVIGALDIKSGKMVIGGWKDTTIFDLKAMIERIKSFGLKEIIFTDVEKDGTLEGIDPKKIKKVIELGRGLNIIYSGGINSIKDLENLNKLNLYGVVIGKAIYEEKIDLEEAIKLFQNK